MCRHRHTHTHTHTHTHPHHNYTNKDKAHTCKALVVPAPVADVVETSFTMVGAEELELLPATLLISDTELVMERGCDVTMTNFCCPPALEGVTGARGVCPALEGKKADADGVMGVDALPGC